MRQVHDRIAIETRGQGLAEITGPLQAWLGRQKLSDGLLTLYLRHTSASLLIQENADPDVLADLQDAFARFAPEDDTLYRHDAEGPDDMSGHIRAALTQSQLAIPVSAGAPLLGTWQGIFVFEHRRAPHQRHVAVHLSQ